MTYDTQCELINWLIVYNFSRHMVEVLRWDLLLWKNEENLDFFSQPNEVRENIDTA